MRITIDREGRTIELSERPVVQDIGFSVIRIDREIRLGQEDVEAQEPEPVEGKDSLGAYTGVSRSITQNYIDSKKRKWEMGRGTLELRAYRDFFAARASCNVDGVLKDDGHFRVDFGDLGELTNLLALYAFCDWWTRPHFDSDLGKLPQRTQMLLWQLEDGEYGCLLPLVDGGAKCHFSARDGKPGADVLMYDSLSSCEGFIFVGGFGSDPYELVTRLVKNGMVLTGNPGRLRWEKPYPEMFNSIGWCSWNALYQDVNETDLLAKMENFKEAGFPVKFVLIDDGWSKVTDHTLGAYDADSQKFQKGLKALVEEMKQEYGISQVGVWHTFTGYWRGVHPDSDIAREHPGSLLKSKKGTIIPYPEESRSFEFWNAWHSWMRRQGIDFVKVDNQGATYQHSRGTLPIGHAARGQQYGLQASIGLNFSQCVINCMCMLNENAWHWVASNISRNSDDFFPDRYESGPEHARQNVYNALLYHNFSWPDWDMWWSEHAHARYHAAMRAISGGPVYFTDKVDEGDYEVLWPLVLSDGSLLRCDQPALPTRDCIFSNPQEAPVPLKVFNTSGWSGMLLALNATEGEQTVTGQFRPADVEGIAGETFAVREYFSEEARVLAREESWELEIEPYGVRLFSVAPVRDGFAVVGLGNKYVSPAAVLAVSSSRAGAHVVLAEGGRLVAYSDSEVKRIVVADSQAAFTQEGGWVTAEIDGAGELDVWIEW